MPPETIRAAVTTVLAGGVERTSLAMWLWTRAMFFGVALDRFSRRFRRGEEGAPSAA
jgi:hypothetical protein